MTKYQNSENIETSDFEVLPAATANATEIFDILASLQKQPKKVGLLQRKSTYETDAQFLLTTAINVVEMTSTLFRKKDIENFILTAAWLSLINEKAKRIALQNQLPVYSNISQNDLRLLAKKSLHVDQIQSVSTILARDYGVILIYEISFPGMKTDGCTFKLSNGTPVIGMSLRYNRYDYFWFTLMHELSHIFLHYENLDKVIIDDLDSDTATDIEVEANRMASEVLIPRNIWRKILLHKTSLEHLIEFSKNAEVHPSIAAGMVRNRTKNFTMYSDLVNSIDLKSNLGIIDV